MVRSAFVLSAMVFAFNAYAEQGADYCSGEARQAAQASGGDPGTVTMRSSSVSGFYVNAYGYAYYQWQRGPETCFISYNVYGTYFGTKCSADYGYSCSVPGAKKRRHSEVQVEDSADYSELVQPVGWRNCVQFGNGTLCEVYGKGSGVDMFGMWRSDKNPKPRDPNAQYRKPTPGSDPWDM